MRGLYNCLPGKCGGRTVILLRPQMKYHVDPPLPLRMNVRLQIMVQAFNRRWVSPCRQLDQWRDNIMDSVATVTQGGRVLQDAK